MGKRKNRLLALLLCAAMVGSSANTSIYAENAAMGEVFVEESHDHEYDLTAAEPEAAGVLSAAELEPEPTQGPAASVPEVSEDTPSADPEASGSPTTPPTEGQGDSPQEGPGIVEPSAQPTEEPSAQPTEAPGDDPTAEPTETPSAEPTETPGDEPTETPGADPTETPGADPAPTEQPAPQDTTSPSISVSGKYHNGNTYCLPQGETITLTVSDNIGLSSVTINGREAATLNGTQTFSETLSAGSYSISATDTSGNPASLSVTINNGHNTYSAPVTAEATCTENAYTGTRQICRTCGNEQGIMWRPNYGTALGHDYQPETWTVNGEDVQVSVCTRCGKVQEGSGPDLDDGKHNWDTKYTVDKERTCTSDGVQSIHCLDPNCSAKKDIETLPALGHVWGSYKTTKPATCTEKGQMERTCTRPGCGAKDGGSIEALGHKWSNAYDCTKASSCERCDVENKDKTIYSEHNFGNTYRSGSEGHWKVCENPGCRQVSEQMEPHVGEGISGDCTSGFKCSVCGYILRQQSSHRWSEYKSDASGHWKECLNPGCNKRTEVVSHTGVDDGNCATPIVCGTCGYKMEETGKEHDLVSGSYLTNSSGHWKKCANPGCNYVTPVQSHHSATASNDCTKSTVCDDCGYVMSSGKSNHNRSRVVTVDGTYHWHACLNPGCTVQLEREEHTPNKNRLPVNIKPATCTEPASFELVTSCTVCYHEISRETRYTTPALGHDFMDWQVEDPKDSCEDTGYRYRICQRCGLKEEDHQNADAHDWEDHFTVDQPATCTEDGSQSIHCKKCSATKESESIPAAHTFDAWVIDTPATCETIGAQHRECTICHETESQEIPALGHSWASTYTVDIPATCTTEGSKSIHCQQCQMVQEGSQQAIPADGHSFGEWEDIDAPDCDDAGSKQRKCDVCGFVETDVVNSLGHAWEGDYTIDKKPNCTESGSMSIHCANCDAVKDSMEIAAVGHNFGDWEHIDTPTCDAMGSDRRVCTVCGEVETQNIVASGHEWMPGFTEDKKATCTENGSESIHCKNCSTVKESRVIPATGHNFSDWEKLPGSPCDETGSEQRKCLTCGYTETTHVIGAGHTWEEEYTIDMEPTCSENGSRSIHCAVCDTIKNSEIIAPLGHDFGDWEDVESPGCDAPGSQKRSCKRCGRVETNNLEKTGHTWEDHYTVDKAASCTADGSESVHCMKCDAVKDSRVISSPGHSYGEWEPVVSANCETGGSEQRTCGVCGYTETRNLSTASHTWAEKPTVVVPPTCTEDGSEAIVCVLCGAVKTSTVLPATGHSFGEWIEAGMGTGEKDAYRVCETCGYIDTHTMGGSEHTWTKDYIVDKPATCTEDGSESIRCEICGMARESRVIPATGHDYQFEVRQPANCTQIGLEVGTCSRCGDEIVNHVDAVGHDFGDWKMMETPECGDSGSEQRVCKICGFSETRYVSEGGHTWEKEYTIDKEPTCTEDGSRSIHCEKCDIEKDSQIIESLGHKWNGGVCERCGQYLELIDEKSLQHRQEELQELYANAAEEDRQALEDQLAAVADALNSLSKISGLGQRLMALPDPKKVTLGDETAINAAAAEYAALTDAERRLLSDSQRQKLISLIDALAALKKVVEIPVVSGQDQKWDVSAGETPTFQLNTPIGEVYSVTVNGLQLTADDFLISEDWLTFSLSPKYYMELEPGEYTLAIYGEDGYSVTTFTITETEEPETDTEQTETEQPAQTEQTETDKPAQTEQPETNKPAQTETAKATEKAEETKSGAVATGDETNLMIWLLVLLVSGSYAVCVATERKRRKSR